jgi:DNA-binding NarL/FixJ family response regulator
MGIPSSLHVRAHRAKRRKTFQQRAERQRRAVLRLAEEGIVAAEIADRLGLSDRTVRRHLAARKKALRIGPSPARG